MKQVEAIISYKIKVKLLGNFDNDQKEEYIVYKKDIGCKDCNLQPHQHDYYNSDLFPGMLKRAHAKATGGRGWCKLSELPEGVTVTKEGFLAKVEVKVML